MPISREEFEKVPQGKATRQSDYLDFLSDGNAYSRKEIAEGLNVKPATVSAAMTKLVKAGIVEKRGSYYAKATKADTEEATEETEE